MDFIRTDGKDKDFIENCRLLDLDLDRRVGNPYGTSPFEDITVDERVTEIVDSLSIGAAIQNMLLEAERLGIGTLWIANTCFAYPELTEFIKEPGQLIGAVALGYAAEAPGQRPRKTLEELVEYRY